MKFFENNQITFATFDCPPRGWRKSLKGKNLNDANPRKKVSREAI